MVLGTLKIFKGWIEGKETLNKAEKEIEVR